MKRRFLYVLFLSFLALYGCVASPVRRLNSDEAKIVKGEIEYFKKTLIGKYNNKDIFDHYDKIKISDFLDYFLESTLLYANPVDITKNPLCDESQGNRSVLCINPVSLEHLIDVLNKRIKRLDDKTNFWKLFNEKRFYYRLTELRNVMLSKDELTLPGELISLASNGSDSVSSNVYKNNNAPLTAKYIYAIRRTYESGNETLKLPVPGFITESEKDAWILLTNHPDEQVRLWVARHQSAPPQCLAKLSHDTSDKVLCWAFLNNNTPVSAKVQISEHYSLNISTLMEKYSRYVDDSIRVAVAKSNQATVELLYRLSSDNVWVREAVASNPNTPPDLLEAMSFVIDHFPNLAIANNPSTPLTTICRYIAIQNVEIREAAKANLKKRYAICPNPDGSH